METRNIDWITSVKEQWDNIQNKNIIGYKVNGTMSVPIAQGNSHYQDVLEWLKENTPEPMYTDEEISEKLEKQTLRDAKYIGKPYVEGGDPISFTKEDAAGLIQIKVAFELGLKETVMHFSNGTKMLMKPYGFKKFAEWFVNERAKFFES